MSAQQAKDGDGYFWTVSNKDKTINIEPVEVWWSRTDRGFRGHTLREEHLVLRQANEHDADVIALPLGMVYDLIDALNKAVMEP